MFPRADVVHATAVRIRQAWHIYIYTLSYLPESVKQKTKKHRPSLFQHPAMRDANFHFFLLLCGLCLQCPVAQSTSIHRFVWDAARNTRKKKERQKRKDTLLPRLLRYTAPQKTSIHYLSFRSVFSPVHHNTSSPQSPPPLPPPCQPTPCSPITWST